MNWLHDVYPDMKEKEKTFGGILTTDQVGWSVAGVVIGLIVGIVFYFVIGLFAIPFALIPLAGGVYLAFGKKYEMSILTYLRLRNQYNKSPKEYTNRRQCIKFSVSPTYDVEKEVS